MNKCFNTGRTHFKKGHIPWNKGLTKETDKRVAEYSKKVGLALRGKPTWNKGKRSIRLCVICGRQTRRGKDGRYYQTCSPKCLMNLRRKITKKLGSRPPSQKGKKWGVDYPIENHPWWKGGITPVRKQIWYSQEFQNWRNTIFERDNYVCQICGKRGGKLHPHHFPITFSEILEKHQIKSLEEAIMCEELWDINNGKTLCVECHRLTPTYGVNNEFRKENIWL